MKKISKTPTATDAPRAPNARRNFVKSVAVGVTSVTFAPQLSAVGEASLPSITALLLDEDNIIDDLPIGVTLRFDPTDNNAVQFIRVPAGAERMQIATYGAGGAGSQGNGINTTGSFGGNGGGSSGNVLVSNLNGSVLTLHIGEGATASEAFEVSNGGAFGGAAGGQTQFDGLDEFANQHPTFGGGGGGYTAVFDGETVLLVGGGGGGASGVGSSGEANPAFGGNAQADTSVTRVGADGTGTYAGEGGQFDQGGIAALAVTDHNGGNGADFVGGLGGTNTDLTLLNAGGAGGGGGAGYSGQMLATGGGGGGSAASGGENVNGSGGGGAGGANYLDAVIVGGEPNKSEVGATGGLGGNTTSSLAAESGADGWINITFSTLIK